MKPVFCAVADDDTGATDLAGMLAEAGLRTVLTIDLPADDQLKRWAADHDAVVVGAGTRALTTGEAYSRTRTAVRALAALDPRTIEVKYCSTFDSTPQGNIGPSIDAAMDELGESFTIALPALPVNGRTTYMGHHFVHQQLLSESSMRNHPLTPMTNPNLVTHLQSQTKREVGLATYPVTAAKLEHLRAGGVNIAIADCISDHDLLDVCEAISNLPLITGSSAPAMKLPCIWHRKGWWTPAERTSVPCQQSGTGYLIVAGSCSEATYRQNSWIASQGASSVAVDPFQLASGDLPSGTISTVVAGLAAGRTVLLTASSTPSAVGEVQRWGERCGYTANEVGLRIAYSLARVALNVMERAMPKGLIVAGGETSGAVCRVLELGALEVGRNIEPGVPLCFSLGRFQMRLALKSGNFGSDDFYSRATAAFERSP
jgi:uncharacterized protein YgbK (DUF1537 family)